MNLDLFVGFLTSRGRLLSIGILLLVTLLLGRMALQVRIEQDNESMKASDPLQEERYRAFEASFGSDESLLLAVTHPRLLAGDGLMLLDALTRDVESRDGVSRVRSLTNLEQVVSGSGGATAIPLVPRPLIRTSQPAIVEETLARNPQWTGLLVSPDRRTAGIAIELETRLGDDTHPGRLIDELRELMLDPAYADAGLHLTGIAVQKHDVTRFISRDQRVLLPLSALVLTLALAFVFRRISGVLLPMLVTATTLVWTLGLYAALGYEVNVITSLLPPVIMVLSIATSMHLYQEWIVLARRGEAGSDLVRKVVRTLFMPCFLTTLTTAIGLASLAGSDIPAVRLFGLFAAVGISFSLLLNLTLMPIGLSFLQPRPARRVAANDLLGRLLRAASALSVRRPVPLLVVTLVLVLLGLAGLRQVRNNTDLVRFLDPHAPLYRDTMFIDQHLTGPNALELVLARKDGAPLTGLEDVRRLAAFTQRLVELDEVTTALSVADLIRQLHRAETQATDLALPEDSDDLLYCFDLLEAAERREDIDRLITADFTTARIAVRLRAIGTEATQRVLERIEAIVDGNLGPEYALLPTGSFYHVVLDSNRLVSSQIRSFSLALGLILLVMGAVFRSARVLLAAAIPNLVPIVCTGGLMGWLGIDLSMATTMIASVAIGIAVDDTIHYIARFRSEQRSNYVRAIRRTTLGTGRVLVMTSVVLALGFWVGAFSSFKPTVYFSLLTGVTILLALVCDLLVLPACLLLLRPRPLAGRAIARVACVLALALALGGPPRAEPAGLLDGSDDELLRRAFVPAGEKPQGEVRLLRRGEGRVVQTVLHSKVLKRVVGKILDKELRNWPEARAGHDESRAYTAALVAARERVAAELEASTERTDRYQSLLIDFVWDGDAALVVIAEPQVEVDADSWRVVGRRDLAVLELAVDYVHENMRLIAVDALGLDDAEAEALVP